MNKININSVVINSLEYDNTRQDLKVNFKSGKIYVYTPVSQEFFTKLTKAQSKGSYFNKNIRNNEALTCLKLIK